MHLNDCNDCARLTLTALAWSGLTLVAAAQSPRLVDGAFLDDLRAEVRTNHPTVAAAKARLHAAEAGVGAVRLWEDPMAGVGVMFAEREMRREDGDLMFSAEQPLPRRGLYEARKASATADLSILEAETRSAVLTLETMVADAAIELALIDETLAIATNQLGWLDSMAINSREQLKDPQSSSAGPLRIESEVAQERQRLEAAVLERVGRLRQLNIILGRATEEDWPALALPESASLPPALTDELARIYQANPMLQTLVSSAAAAKSEIEVARRERRPTFAVGVESSVYSGGDFRQATVGAKMTLPWLNNSVYRANTERARHQQAAVEREVEALARRLRGEAIAAHTDAENWARQALTFAKEVIPRAARAAEATEQAWISSKASLLEVLESRRALLSVRLEERRAVAAHRTALETLRSIVPPGTQP